MNTLQIKTEVKLELEDIKYALDKLLDIAEEYYPKYYSSDMIAEILDMYKQLFDGETLHCTHEQCREFQVEGGEYCAEHLAEIKE